MRGVGIDIVEIQRFEEAIKRFGDDFLKKIFTEKELKYSLNKKNKFQHLAARFACKEAVIKAIGKSLNLKEIEILNEPNGKPFCKINNSLYKDSKIFISLSHTHNYATAIAILT